MADDGSTQYQVQDLTSDIALALIQKGHVATL
jgi:hypothetical protein